MTVRKSKIRLFHQYSDYTVAITHLLVALCMFRDHVQNRKASSELRMCKVSIQLFKQSVFLVALKNRVIITNWQNVPYLAATSILNSQQELH